MIEIFEDGLHGADDEGEADEHHGDDDAGGVVGGLNVELGEELADPAFGCVDGAERDASDSGGEREGDIDEGVDDALAGEGVAGEHPRDDDAEDGVDDGGDERSADGELVGGEGTRVGDDRPELGGAEPGREECERGEGKQDDEAHVGEGVAHREAEAGEDALG